MEATANAADKPSLRQENALLTGQKRVLEMIATGGSVDDTLSAIVRFIEAREKGLRCGVLIVSDDGRFFRRGSGPRLPESYHVALDGAPITPPYLGPCGQAAHTDAAVIVPDIAADSRWADPWRELVLGCGLKACRSTPVRGSDGRVLASLAMYYDRPRDPRPAHPELIEIATHLAGIALEQERTTAARRIRQARREGELGAMERLRDISTELIDEDDVDALYDKLLEVAMTVMRSDAASLQMMTAGGNELRLLASNGLQPESVAYWQRVGADSASACGQALARGERVILEDVEADRATPVSERRAYRRSSIRAVQSTPLRSRSGRPVGMISTHWRHPRRPDEVRLRMLDILARQAADLIERARTEESLGREVSRSRRVERAAQQLAAIVESSDDAIASKDLNGVLQTWNRGAEQLFGYTAEEAIGQSVAILMPDGYDDEERGILARIRRGESIENHDTVRRRKDGSLVDISLTVSPIRDSRGRLVGASKIAHDIAERRAAEARQRLLLREVNHRAKNMLHTVQSIAIQTRRGAASLTAFEKSFMARLTALSHAHDLLAANYWRGASLRDLVDGELAPYRDGGEPTRTRLDGDDIELDARTALALGMAFHELATNAAKYGALSVTAGTVSVTWRRESARSGAPAGLCIEWVERNGPPVEPPQRRGFGSRLIERGLSHELDAEARVNFESKGVRCRIDMTWTPGADRE